MATADRDPSSETPPNFQAAAYALIRRALIDQHQRDGTELDDEGAAKQLLDTWEEERQVRQRAWEEAAAEKEREREEAEAERLREESEARKAEEKKKKVKFPPLVPGLPPPKDSGFRPCQKAITKLGNLEFVELWFFTFDGCKITKEATITEEDNTISFTQENGHIQLRKSSSVASYKHLIVPDERLTWKDLLQAKNVFLECIDKNGWPDSYLKMFTNFYCKLEFRPELRQTHGHGEKILILYHARARREWFDSVRLQNLFDLSIIDEDWMSEAHKEMWDNIHTQGIQRIQRVEEKVRIDLNLCYTYSRRTFASHLTTSNCMTSHVFVPCYIASRIIASCFMLHASCYMLHATCYTLHASCYILHAPRFIASCFASRFTHHCLMSAALAASCHTKLYRSYSSPILGHLWDPM